MLKIPLQPVPSQTVCVVLAGQRTQIFVYQKPQGVFVDTNANGVDISAGVLAHNSVPLVTRDYAGFVGNLMFQDAHGTADPDYTGIGSRFVLLYLSDTEYAQFQQ